MNDKPLLLLQYISKFKLLLLIILPIILGVPLFIYDNDDTSSKLFVSDIQPDIEGTNIMLNGLLLWDYACEETTFKDDRVSHIKIHVPIVGENHHDSSIVHSLVVFKSKYNHENQQYYIDEFLEYIDSLEQLEKINDLNVTYEKYRFPLMGPNYLGCLNEMSNLKYSDNSDLYIFTYKKHIDYFFAYFVAGTILFYFIVNYWSNIIAFVKEKIRKYTNE